MRRTAPWRFFEGPLEQNRQKQSIHTELATEARLQQQENTVKLAILGTKGSWHVERLTAAATRLGIEAQAVDFRKLVASLGPADCALELDGFDLMGVRGALVRGIPAGSLEQVVFRMDALHRLEAAGIKVINSARSIEACVDKYLATARLQGQGLPIPRTIVCEGLEEAMAAFHRLGGDVVVKPLFGSEGRGILRAETEALAYRIFWTLFKLQSILYVQEFVEHPGYDLRLFVLGKRVAAGMKRYAAHDFRTNVAQGGSFEAYVPNAEVEELAIRAAAAVGAEIAGVDLLTGPDHRPLVLEVNSTPGFQALAQTTEVDIAAAILRHVMNAIERG